jgi:hypothetical protein
MIRNEIAEIIYEAYWSTPTHRDSQSLTVADRIIALLDKKVQEAGWRVDGPSGLMSVEVIGNDSPATFEDVISGKAVKR